MFPKETQIFLLGVYRWLKLVRMRYRMVRFGYPQRFWSLATGAALLMIEIADSPQGRHWMRRGTGSRGQWLLTQFH